MIKEPITIDKLEPLKDESSLMSVELVERMNEKFNRQKNEFMGFTKFHNRVVQLNSVEEIDLGQHLDNKYFFTKREAEAEWAKLYVSISGLEKLLFDPEVYDSTGLSSIESWSVDPKGEKVIVLVSKGGDEVSEIIILEVTSGLIIDGPSPKLKYSDVLWSKEGNGFWYVKHQGEDLDFNRAVFWHSLKGDFKTDDLVFGSELDSNTYFGLDSDEEKRYIIITTFVGCDPFNEVWLGEIQPQGGDFSVLKVVDAGYESSVGLVITKSGQVFMHSDFQASRGRVLRFTVEELLTGESAFPGGEDKVFADEDEIMILEDFDFDESHDTMFLLYNIDTLSQIQAVSLKDGEPLYKVPQLVSGAIGEICCDSERPGELYYTLSNPATREKIYKYELSTRELSLKDRGAESEELEGITFEQISYLSYDGTLVSANLTMPKNYVKGSRVPVIIYGYGGFSISLEPEFHAGAVAWVEEGNIWVDAHLRGGGEQGEVWHEEGMREKKQNTFDDLYALAEFLIEEGYTSSELLGIRGGSNGGLLVGTAVVQRPELFKAAISEAALLDMIEFPNYGLGENWVSEYGDPRITQEREWIIKYSPLHNISEGVTYPVTLVVNYENDSRVDNLHGRRFAYALEGSSHNPQDVFLLTVKDAGHAGDSVSKSNELSATFLAFFKHHLAL